MNPSEERFIGLIVSLPFIKVLKIIIFHLRSVVYHDEEQDREFVFLTNDFELPALAVAELYRNRWNVELFFK